MYWVQGHAYFQAQCICQPLGIQLQLCGGESCEIILKLEWTWCRLSWWITTEAFNSTVCWLEFDTTHCSWLQYAAVHIEGILPKGPYLPCVSMAGRAFLAGYHRYVMWSEKVLAFHSKQDNAIKNYPIVSLVTRHRTFELEIISRRW